MNNCSERCNCQEGDPAIATPGYLARRRHDNAGDLDASRQILTWLREGKAVCHPRFSNGEFYSAMGLVDNYGGHPYMDEVRIEIREVLRDLAGSSAAINTSANARVLVGGEWEYDPAVWRFLTENDLQDRIPWCPAQAPVQGIWDGSTLEILEHVRNARGVRCLIANPEVCEVVHPALRAKAIMVRRRGSWHDMAWIRRRLQGLPPGSIVLWCAGIGCKLTMWKAFRENPGTTHLDFGHFFDLMVGDESRTWLTLDNPRMQCYLETVVPWFESKGVARIAPIRTVPEVPPADPGFSVLPAVAENPRKRLLLARRGKS